MTKFKRIQYLILFVLTLRLCTTPALAEESQSYGLVYSDILSPSDYGLGVGYRLSSTMYLEMSYLSIRSVPVFGSANFYSVSGLNIGVVGYLPVLKSLDFVGKIGSFSSAAQGKAMSSNYNNTTVSTGMGIQYSASQNFSLLLLIENLGVLKSSDADNGWEYSLITAGGRYNF
jgi:hypothetical protein